ncbi:MAG: hypothetical protein LBH17_07140, partial [Oscillospiraceae bacterium]|nr:hypothetical protein [Oscillospiraceae bacterium]
LSGFFYLFCVLPDPSWPYRSASFRLCRRNFELQSYSIINASELQQPKIPAKNTGGEAEAYPNMCR